MAVRVILGKPGGGKSFICLVEIIEELVYGCRVIVTNLPLDLPALNAYIQKNYPKEDIDLHDRVRILSEEETKFFFAHRHNGCDFRVPSEDETKRGVRIDYGDIGALRPVFYVIDEAHTHFDARAWMNSGPHLTFYNSQHRKPGDEVFFVTQFVELLDKRCTGFAQEFWTVRNYGMERLSIFKGPKGQHVCTTTLARPGPNVPTMNTRYFRLDLKIAECYSTTSGVGMSGRKAKPREKETKGVPWYVAVPLVIGLIVALVYLPDLLTKGLLKGVGTISDGAVKATGAIASPKGALPVASVAAVPERREAPAAASSIDPVKADELFVVGISANGRSAVVWLSNGDVLEWDDIREVNTRTGEVRTMAGDIYRMGSKAQRTRRNMELAEMVRPEIDRQPRSTQ